MPLEEKDCLIVMGAELEENKVQFAQAKRKKLAGWDYRKVFKLEVMSSRNLDLLPAKWVNEWNG